VKGAFLEGGQWSLLLHSWEERLDELRHRKEELAEAFRRANPVPHVVIDDFLPPEIAEGVLAEFPERDASLWAKLPTEDQRGKLATTSEAALPTSSRFLIYQLNSGAFLHFLEEITGIPDLIADTKLVGGGLHRIEPGGKLSVHVDFSHHPSNGLYRRLNLLIYLNKNWREEYGGHFELWTPALDKPVQRILPIFNRCVVFATSSRSFHGHPEPLTCPPGEARKSLALYYFTRNGPDGDDAVHNTTFKSRPGDRTSIGDRLVRAASSGAIRDLIPPIVYRAVRKFWNRRIAGK
jgi:Rps23 Pro-64 3,4-dihydroxylase Tpa1-like proline 4-hydroxylase